MISIDRLIYIISLGVILLIGMPTGLIFYVRYWNNTKFIKAQLAKIPIDTFGTTYTKWKEYAFNEDEYRALPKLEAPIFDKLLNTKNLLKITLLISFTITLIPFATGLTTPIGGWILLALLIAPIPFTITYRQSYQRYTSIESARNAQIQRMYDIANTALKFDPTTAYMPQSVVNVTKWKDQTIPASIVILYPTTFRADTQTAREGFESIFNTAITEENAWIYTWHPTKNAIQCRPVEDLPTMVEYKGAGPFEWHTFPIGVGLGPKGQEIISYSVNKNKTGIYYPHLLLGGTTGSGKNLDLKSKIKTPDGTVSLGDLKVGDELFGPDGNITKVTHLHPIITPEKAYKVVFSDGEELVVDAEHLWFTETREARVSASIQHGKQHRGMFNPVSILSDEQVAVLKAELENTTDSNTISIPEVAELAGVRDTADYLFKIAKIIGVAEEVHPTTKFYYKAQTVVQEQLLTFCNAQEFIEVYNNYAFRRTVNTPLLKSDVDKISNLRFEVRNTDKFTVDSVIEYLGVKEAKAAVDWVDKNFKGDVEEFAVKAEKLGKGLLPNRILDFNNEYVTKYDFAALCDGVDEQYAFNTFANVAKKVKDRYSEKTAVELFVPEKTLERKNKPYFTYPKKMFIEHLIAYGTNNNLSQQHKHEFGSVKTTQEILDSLYFVTPKGERIKNHWVPQTKTLQLPEKVLPVAPYSFGAWLGDGYIHSGNVCGVDHEVFLNIKNEGYEPTEKSINVNPDARKHENFRVVSFPELRKTLRQNGFLLKQGQSLSRDGTTKHIPVTYLRASENQRRSLLAGLMDTDGTVDPSGSVSFCTVIPALKDGFVELVRTLGYVPRVSSAYKTNTSTGKTGKLAYTITFNADPADKIFRLTRKQKLHEERYKGDILNTRGDGRYIVDIVEVSPVPMRCISVDSPTRLFLAGEGFIPTHNSVIQRNIIFHCIQHNDMWRFLGVDLKRVELSRFRRYTETVLGIATDLEQGVEVCRYAHDVMMERYAKMEEAGVNIFLDMVDENGKPDYAIMLMIDEAFMFMSPEGNKTEEGKVRDAMHAEASQLIGDIARLGRAAGVHLVLATQRPDATVIKGELKNNLDVRIAAGRLDTIPSNMVLDSQAATMLPAIKGRGIIRLGGENKMFQGFFAEQEWIDQWLAKPQNRWREPELFKDAKTKTNHVQNDPNRLSKPEPILSPDLDVEEFDDFEEFGSFDEFDDFENEALSTPIPIPVPVGREDTVVEDEAETVSSVEPEEVAEGGIGNIDNDLLDEDDVDISFMYDDEIDEFNDINISDEEIESLLAELAALDEEEGEGYETDDDDDDDDDDFEPLNIDDEDSPDDLDSDVDDFLDNSSELLAQVEDTIGSLEVDVVSDEVEEVKPEPKVTLPKINIEEDVKHPTFKPTESATVKPETTQKPSQAGALPVKPKTKPVETQKASTPKTKPAVIPPRPTLQRPQMPSKPTKQDNDVPGQIKPELPSKPVLPKMPPRPNR